jgi:hypothetical protein
MKRPPTGLLSHNHRAADFSGAQREQVVEQVAFVDNKKGVLKTGFVFHQRSPGSRAHQQKGHREQA